MQERIYGDATPVLELVLNPGERVLSWAGDAAWMTDSIEVAPAATDERSWLGKLFGSKQADGNALVAFAATVKPGMVAFAPRLPGEVVKLDVRPDETMTYLCNADTLLCIEDEVEVGRVSELTGMGTGLYGQGFSLLRLTGNGRAWLGLAGHVVSYELRPEETVRVHPGHLGIVQDTVTVDVTGVPSVRTPSFPDGIRFLELSGPGRIWLTSTGSGPLAEAVDDFSIPTDLPGVPAKPQRGVLREVLFPRP